MEYWVRAALSFSVAISDRITCAVLFVTRGESWSRLLSNNLWGCYPLMSSGDLPRRSPSSVGALINIRNSGGTPPFEHTLTAMSSALSRVRYIGAMLSERARLASLFVTPAPSRRLCYSCNASTA